MTEQTWWDGLAVAALLGTDRRPTLDTSSLPGPLAAAAAQLSGDPAAVLLDTAALAVAYRRAGAPPQRAGAEPDRALAEARRRPTPRAGALLEAVLRSDVQLLRFWCETAAAADLVAPDEHLPALLDRAVQLPAIRPAIGLVLGERGRWLARMHPRWAAAVDVPADDSNQVDSNQVDSNQVDPNQVDQLDPQPWRFGDHAARTAWLRLVRRQQPGLGLAALADTWPRESGPDRAAFVALLAEGLSADDEAFLEAALDDRVSQVRMAAAELLAMLPDSAYAGRMRRRAESFLRRDRGLLRGRVVIEVPDRLDPTAARDGITDLPSGRPITADTRKQWWLEQIVAAVPLDAWPALLGRSGAQRAVRIGFDDVAQPAIRAGWAWAAVRQRNREWALAVLGTGTRLRVEELLPLLSDAELATVLRDRLRVLGPADVGLLAGYLSTCPAPWPEPVALDVLGWLLAAIPGLNPLGNQATPLLDLIAFRFPLDDGAPAAVGAAVASVEDNFWRSRLGSVARILKQRIRIHKELQ
jgi:Family of unknown function (DUF5691)